MTAMIGQRLASRTDVALLLPPVVWSAYFALAYGATAVVCDHAAIGPRPAGHATFLVLAGLITLLTLLPMAWTGGAALARLRRGDTCFLTRVAGLMAATFIVATLYIALPIVWLTQPCL
jgi:hypothetical protein